MAEFASINQLVVVTTFGAQAGALIDRLTENGFYVTQVNSSGGLLYVYGPRISLLVGVTQERLPELLEHIRDCCATRRRFVQAQGETLSLEARPMMLEAEMGGATIYVFDVEHFEQL